MIKHILVHLYLPRQARKHHPNHHCIVVYLQEGNTQPEPILPKEKEGKEIKSTLKKPGETLHIQKSTGANKV